jgi:hypothetical protein
MLYDAAVLLAKYAGATRGSRIEASAGWHVALIERQYRKSRRRTPACATQERAPVTPMFTTRQRGAIDVELGSDEGAADQRVSNDAAEAQALLLWLRASGVAR